jgi:hypothetical protein
MPGGRLTRDILRSHAEPVLLYSVHSNEAQRRCLRDSLTRPYTKAAGLLNSTSNHGTFGKWMHRFGQRDIGLHINERLGLEAGSRDPSYDEKIANED